MFPDATILASRMGEQPEISVTIKRAVDQARLVIGRFDASWGNALARTDQVMMRALEALYEVCVAFDRQPRQREPFLRSAKVNPHGNVRNPYQPIVRALLKDCHGDLRARITRYAGIVALARSDKVPPREFVRFVKHEHGGVAGAYKEFTRRQRVPREQLHRLKERKAIVDRFIETGINVSFPCPSQMEGHSGIALAVVDVTDGHFRVLRLLDHRPEEIERLVEHQARNWVASQTRQS